MAQKGTYKPSELRIQRVYMLEKLGVLEPSFPVKPSSPKQAPVYLPLPPFTLPYPFKDLKDLIKSKDL